MAPSWVDIVALILSGAMLIATIFIITYNAKTVKAALNQVKESQKSRTQEESLNLYPLRRDLLKMVESGDESSIGDIGVDIELLLPKSLDVYKDYVTIQKSYDDVVFKKQALEDVITSNEWVDENSLVLAKRIEGECTDEDVFNGHVEPFSGIGGNIFNPDTGEKEYVDWDDLNTKTALLKTAEEDAFLKLRTSMKEEIVASLKPLD